MDESSGVTWLDRHLATTTRSVLSTPWIPDLDTTLKRP
jgi:SH3-like domain-containing protein